MEAIRSGHPGVQCGSLVVFFYTHPLFVFCVRVFNTPPSGLLYDSTTWNLRQVTSQFYTNHRSYLRWNEAQRRALLLLDPWQGRRRRREGVGKAFKFWEGGLLPGYGRRSGRLISTRKGFVSSQGSVLADRSLAMMASPSWKFKFFRCILDARQSMQEAESLFVNMRQN